MRDVDVIVVGSGASGLTTAVVAALHGLDVLLVESRPSFGGTTAFSGGGIWVPCNAHMFKHGHQDSRAEADGYLRGLLGNLYDEERVGAFLDNAPAMLAFMERSATLEVLNVPLPDYEPQFEGWKAGRMVMAAPYDARHLGPIRKMLRPPRPELVLFHSMQFALYDLPMLRNAHRRFRAFFHSGKLVAQYLWQRLFYGRGMRVAAGNALAARLLRSALDAGVALAASTPVKQLLMSDDAVVGVVIERDGVEQRVGARKGVVLATGGFGANEAMRTKYIPHAGYGPSLQPEGNRGEGLQMGLDAGGYLRGGNVANGVWQISSQHRYADGGLAVSIHALMDRFCPGSLIVDAATGRRFADEGSNYQAIGQAMHRGGVERAWMISEGPAARKYGMGLAKPWPFRITPWIRNGYIRTDATIRGLAVKLGLDADILQDTIATFNAHAINGVDPDFGRGESPYSRFVGDPDQVPNPSLGPIRSPPFYAVEMRPCDLSTLVGLGTNADAQVITGEGRAIKGLYAVGLDSNDLWHGHYPGGGATIAQGMTFGYIAARHLAGATTI